MRFRATMVVLTVLLLAGAVGAQTKSFQFGIKGGVNMAKLVYDPEAEGLPIENLMGFGGGIVLGFPLSSAVSLDLEGMYMMKGMHYELTGQVQGVDFTSESDTKLDYIVACPMLRIRIPSGGLTPYIMGGGEVGFLMSAKVKSTVTMAGQEEESTTDVKDDMESLDYGVNVGAGLEIPAGSGGIFFEARYSLGLADIGKDQQGEGILEGNDEATIKNQGIYLLAGLRF
jgi:hypothetical protein